MAETLIKVCGVTRADDAGAAAGAGAGAVGLVFYPDSRRAVTLGEACAAVRGLPKGVKVVGLFVDAAAAAVREACAELPLDLLQFHGAEEPEWCGQFGVPWMKALRVGAPSAASATPAARAQAEESLSERAGRYHQAGAAAILLDTFKQGVAGGTGEAFDWGLIPQRRPWRLALAGGLHAGNVGAAIAAARPWAVDVSGGVEEAPGRKSRAKIEAFVRAVREADRRNDAQRNGNQRNGQTELQVADGWGEPSAAGGGL